MIPNGGGNVFIGQHKSHAGALSWTENELSNVFLRLVLDSEDTIRLLGQTWAGSGVRGDNSIKILFPNVMVSLPSAFDSVMENDIPILGGPVSPGMVGYP